MPRASDTSADASASDDEIIYVPRERAGSVQPPRTEARLGRLQASGSSSPMIGKKRKRQASDDRPDGTQSLDDAAGGIGRPTAGSSSSASSTLSSNGTVKEPGRSIDEDPLACVQTILKKLKVSKDWVRAECKDPDSVETFDDLARKVRLQYRSKSCCCTD